MDCSGATPDRHTRIGSWGRVETGEAGKGQHSRCEEKMGPLVSTSFYYTIQPCTPNTSPATIRRHTFTSKEGGDAGRCEDLRNLQLEPWKRRRGQRWQHGERSFCGCRVVTVKLFARKADCVAWRRGGGNSGGRRLLSGGEVSLCNMCLDDVAKGACGDDDDD